MWGIEDQTIATLHIGAEQIVRRAVGIDIRRLFEIRIQHVGIVVRRHRLEAVGPVLRAAHELQPTRLARHSIERDPDRTQRPRFHIHRPKRHVVMPRRRYVTACRLDEELIVEVPHAPRA